MSPVYRDLEKFSTPGNYLEKSWGFALSKGEEPCLNKLLSGRFKTEPRTKGDKIEENQEKRELEGLAQNNCTTSYIVG